MSEPFRGVVNLDIRESVPDWTPYEQPRRRREPRMCSTSWWTTSLQHPGGPLGAARPRRRAPRPAHRARIKTQPGKFAIAGEGLCVGRDSGEPVTDDYPGEPPWAFTGGTLHRVAIDVSGEPYLNLEREAAAMLARE
jgi:hypothetical protein